jgi:hypothetical protein
MTEALLHFCWRWRRFDFHALTTTDGQPLEILHPGEPNPHAGPDFFNARIRLDGTLWAGTVELHLRASQWLEHGHTADRAYDNVVLHVVLDDDVPVRRANGERLPCLALRRRLLPRVLEAYRRFEHERQWIPCAGQLPAVPSLIWHNWLDRLLVERLEEKTAAVAEVLEAAAHDWEEAFYRLVARGYGLHINVEPFDALARALPWRLLRRYRHDRNQVEALIFGQAGLLDGELSDPYPQALAREYRFQRHKLGLTPLDAHVWKFLRLRPANFPTIRLAQFAAFWQAHEAPFNAVLEARTLPEVEALFFQPAHSYWNDRFQFDKPSGAQSIKMPGADAVHRLLINSVAPLLFYYGKVRAEADEQSKALYLLEALPAESNAIIDGWKELGRKAKNAHQTQALLQCKTRWCDHRRCLDCAVGNAILK